MGLQQPGERLKALGKAFKDPIRSLGAIGHYLAGRVTRQVTKPSLTKVHPTLAPEADLVATLVHDLALAVEQAVMKHGKEIVERQFIQERLANAAIDIFMAAATLSRTTWEIERLGGEEAATAQLDCARVFVPMAYRRARRQIRALSRHQDARLRAIADASLLTGDLGPESATDV
jgi:acyl-CoA dehydrogenase family protein 9